MTKNALACLILTAATLVSACGSGLSTGESKTASGAGGGSPSSFKKIFVTSGTYNGNLRGAQANGPAGADAICMADTNYPGTGTYKAMIADGANRVACTTADCGGGTAEHTNWVLAPSTEYRRADDGTTVIGTTTVAGIFIFPIDNTVVDGASPEANDIWTGLDGDWTTYMNTCLQFTSNSGAQSAMMGVSYVDSANTIRNGGGAICSMTARLYCVEQ